MTRKSFLTTATAIVLLFAMNSCKKDVLDLDKTLKFSTQTVEQQKQSIEQNGIDLLDKMDALRATKAMVAIEAFSSNSNSTNEPTLVKSIGQLRASLLKNDVNAVETFNKQMRLAAASNEEEIWGTRTWIDGNFEFVAGPDNTATFLFPATEGSTANNGELKIIYTPSTVVMPDVDPVEYMPKSISVVLKVSGTVALTANYSGSYKTDATPTKITQTLQIEKYNWKLEFTNDDKDVSAKYAFNYNKDVLLKYELGAAGSLTAKNILDNIEDNPENVLTSGAMYFQVLNIAILGGIKDFKGFAAQMKANAADGKAMYDNEATIMNKYLKMYGYFVKENRKFADVEFYVFDDPDTYSGTTNHYYSTEPRFVLSDGSKVTIQTYLETGFEDLANKLNGY